MPPFAPAAFLRRACRPPAAQAPRHARGLTLIELVVFIVIVSGALVAMLSVFTSATGRSADPLLRRQALAIAESLLEEVQSMPFTYCDPDDASVESAASGAGCASLADASGPEAGETRFATPQFDGVTDYHGYSMSSIVDLTNAAVAGLSGYAASVSVAPAALGSITAGSGDALRITVTVTGPAGTTLSLDGYRSRHAPNAAL